MCLAKFITVTFSVVSPREIINPVHDSQARFSQFRATESFYVASSNKRNDLVRISKVFIERTWRASISSFLALRKLIAFQFPQIRNKGRSGLT